jgi:hypothetical protein
VASLFLVGLCIPPQRSHSTIQSQLVFKIDLGMQEEVKFGRKKHYPNRLAGPTPSCKSEIKRLFPLNFENIQFLKEKVRSKK